VAVVVSVAPDVVSAATVVWTSPVVSAVVAAVVPESAGVVSVGP
jgi:hypothetical protein